MVPGNRGRALVVLPALAYPPHVDRGIAIRLTLCLVVSAAATACASRDDDEMTFHQEVAWSPDGSRIAFSALRVSRSRWLEEKHNALTDARYDIFVMQADGSRSKRLTQNPADDLWLSWSPDGSRIVFGSRREGNADLYVMSASGGPVTRLTSDPMDESGPSWSPDGSRIAFMVKQGERWQIFVMDVDGSNRRRLTESSGNDWNPAWSPDGSRIVFYSDREGPGKDAVYVMNADGSNPVRVTSGVFPAWSPDGTKILFGTEQVVCSIRPDGSGRTPLIEKGDFARWSHDGKLAYIAGEFPDTRIYVAGADGSDPVPLTH